MASPDVERLKTMADAVHHAALNLASTYGTFLGVNAMRNKEVVNPHVAVAINSVQHDLLHLMVVRLCGLCDYGSKPDDASIFVLAAKITPAIRQELVATDKEFRRVMGQRAQRVPDVAHSLANLRRRRAALRSRAALVSIKHFRNKLLAHVTVGHNASNTVRLGDLWNLTKTALGAARDVGLVLHRKDHDYMRESRTARKCGRALAIALLKKKQR